MAKDPVVFFDGVPITPIPMRSSEDRDNDEVRTYLDMLRTEEIEHG
jgi:hypothetical protein